MKVAKFEYPVMTIDELIKKLNAFKEIKGITGEEIITDMWINNDQSDIKDGYIMIDIFDPEDGMSGTVTVIPEERTKIM